MSDSFRYCRKWELLKAPTRTAILQLRSSSFVAIRKSESFSRGAGTKASTSMQEQANRISPNLISSTPKSATGSNGETAKDVEHLRYQFLIVATMPRLPDWIRFR